VFQVSQDAAGVCRFRPSCLLTLLLVLFCFPPDAGAQVLYGSLTGTVTDASEAGIPTAKVEATNSNTGVTKQTATDSVAFTCSTICSRVLTRSR
jgi:hypothetical protein